MSVRTNRASNCGRVSQRPTRRVQRAAGAQPHPDSAPPSARSTVPAAAAGVPRESGVIPKAPRAPDLGEEEQWLELDDAWTA